MAGWHILGDLFSPFMILPKKNIATKTQIPLRLAFAVTVHRAQGLTLHTVMVHCKGMPQPGMLAVACSRVRQSNDPNTIGFRPEIHGIKPCTLVQDFITWQNSHIQSDTDKHLNSGIISLLEGVNWDD